MFIFTLNKVSRVSWRSLRCDVTDRDSPSLPQTSHRKREERTARRETRLEQGMRVCRIKKFCLLSPRVAPKLRVGYTAKGQRGLRERVCLETNSTIKRHGHEISYQMLYALKRTLQLRHHIMVETSNEKRFTRIWTSTLFLHFLFQSIQRFLCSTRFGNAEIPPGANKRSTAEQIQRAFEFSIQHSLQRTVIEKHTIMNRRPEIQKVLTVRDTSTVTASFSLARKVSKVSN